AAPSPQISKQAIDVIASKMTKASSVFKIPLPSDGVPKHGNSSGVITRIGTVSEITAFYDGWMTAHGWTFEPRYSTMNPGEGVSKSLGYTTSQTWCKRTAPITTVSIIVGSGDKVEHGKYAEVFLTNLRDEESCP